MKLQKKPYSYHTFIYTFKYNECEEESKGKYEKVWEKIKDVEDILSGNTESEEELEAYNSLHYFNPKARNAIFNTKNDNTSENYRYIMPVGKTLKYEISLSKDDEKISLPIKGMKLTIYKRLKIGIISISVINYDYIEEDDVISSTREMEKMARVAQINEWGRRLFFPDRVINGENKQKSYIETKALGIYAEDEYGKVEEIVFTDFVQQYEENKSNYNNMGIKPQFIDKLLGPKLKNDYKIKDFYSVFDDRMFTCCLVKDQFISDEMKIYDKEKEEYAYCLHGRKITNTDVDIGGMLYSYVFVDSDLTACSCQNTNFRRELLKKHIYDRWIDYGTLYGFTEYSMMCITGEGGFPIVKKSFLTQYVELAKLCLMQRASINIIETDIVNFCKTINLGKKENIDSELVSEIWKKYIIFQCELYLPEVTFQEQGVEIYAFLKRYLEIEELNSQIEAEIDNLHELTELMDNKQIAENERKTTKAMNGLNIFLGLVALVDLLALIDRLFVAKESYVQSPFFTINLPANVIKNIEIGGIIFILCLTIYIGFKIKILSSKRGKRRK